MPGPNVWNQWGMCWKLKRNFGWRKGGFELPVPRILPIFLEREWRGLLATPAASPAVPLMLVWLRKIPCTPQDRAHPSAQHSAAADIEVCRSFINFSFHSTHHYPFLYSNPAGPMPTSHSPVHTTAKKLSLHLLQMYADPLCPADHLLHLFDPSLECYDVYGIV